MTKEEMNRLVATKIKEIKALNPFSSCSASRTA